jgi:hypothetical protein
MIDTTPNPLTYTDTEFRRAMKVSRTTLQKLRRAGLYHIKIGRKLLYNQRSIEDFFDRLEVRDQ